MNKQELQNKINKTKEYLANMEKMLAECEYERWKPKYIQEYYSINAIGEVTDNIWQSSDIDECKYDFYNCFQTREQAETEAENILVRRMLEDIARRLNKGEEIDWYNPYQERYCIYYDCKRNEIDSATVIQTKTQGCIHCLDMNFKDVAIQEIGEERLKKYLRGE